MLQKLLRKVRKGTRLVFIPGNHDEGMREYCGMHVRRHRDRAQHHPATADGRRYLVIHGDEFDVVVRYAKWLAFLGDWGYELALWTNTHFNCCAAGSAGLLVAVGLSQAQGQDAR